MINWSSKAKHSTFQLTVRKGKTWATGQEKMFATQAANVLVRALRTQ